MNEGSNDDGIQLGSPLIVELIAEPIAGREMPGNVDDGGSGPSPIETPADPPSVDTPSMNILDDDCAMESCVALNRMNTTATNAVSRLTTVECAMFVS